MHCNDKEHNLYFVLRDLLMLIVLQPSEIMALVWCDF